MRENVCLSYSGWFFCMFLFLLVCLKQHFTMFDNITFFVISFCSPFTNSLSLTPSLYLCMNVCKHLTIVCLLAIKSYFWHPNGDTHKDANMIVLACQCARRHKSLSYVYIWRRCAFLTDNYGDHRQKSFRSRFIWSSSWAIVVHISSHHHTSLFLSFNL